MRRPRHATSSSLACSVLYTLSVVCSDESAGSANVLAETAYRSRLVELLILYVQVARLLMHTFFYRVNCYFSHIIITIIIKNELD